MMDSESFKDELRKLCMELDIDVGEYSAPSPIGTISCLRGCEMYRYYLTKIGIHDSEFVEEVDKYEREYDKNKKRVVYKTCEPGHKMNPKEISNETEAKKMYQAQIKQIKSARTELHKLQKRVEYLDNEIEELCDFAENNGWKLIDDPIIRVD